jgi:hypothetical protein
LAAGSHKGFDVVGAESGSEQHETRYVLMGTGSACDDLSRKQDSNTVILKVTWVDVSEEQDRS